MWDAKYKAFWAQRYTAKQRGILWAFTFEDWCQWWEQQLGPDWFSKRGRHRGEYCMARIGDKGIYRWGNVRCILHDQNMRDTKVNGTSSTGEKHGMHKLTEQQVLSIRQMRGTLRFIATKFGVHYDTIRLIKAGQVWSHLAGPIVPYVKDKRGYHSHKGQRGPGYP